MRHALHRYGVPDAKIIAIPDEGAPAFETAAGPKPLKAMRMDERPMEMSQT